MKHAALKIPFGAWLIACAFAPVLAQEAPGAPPPLPPPPPSTVPSSVVPPPAVAIPTTQAPIMPVDKPAAKTVPVTLVTSAGAITIAVEIERAPITAANFLRYVDGKRLDGTTFYRGFTFPERPDVGLIQGGTQNDPKRVLKPIAHEPTSKTGLTHDDGAVSLARSTPGSGTADFFIIIGEMKGLDADPSKSGDNQGFAVFGHVTSGMDVVRTIATAPHSPTAGIGPMKGQMLAPPIKIFTARRVAKP